MIEQFEDANGEVEVERAEHCHKGLCLVTTPVLRLVTTVVCRVVTVQNSNGTTPCTTSSIPQLPRRQ